MYGVNIAFVCAEGFLKAGEGLGKGVDVFFRTEDGFMITSPAISKTFLVRYAEYQYGT
jgi:hypothetical protein